MNAKTLLKFKDLWWWRVGGKIVPEIGANFTVGKGEPFPTKANLRTEYKRHSHAAWRYEIGARIRQKEIQADFPQFRHGVPYSQLPEELRENLAREFPSRRFRYSIQEVKPLRKDRPPTMDIEDWEHFKITRNEHPPEGFLDLHIRFHPRHTGNDQIMKYVKAWLERNNPKCDRLSGFRTRDYSWGNIELIDRWLTEKAPLSNYHKVAARNCLRDWGGS